MVIGIDYLANVVQNVHTENHELVRALDIDECSCYAVQFAHCDTGLCAIEEVAAAGCLITFVLGAVENFLQMHRGIFEIHLTSIPERCAIGVSSHKANGVFSAQFFTRNSGNEEVGHVVQSTS
jgi:hypothetical protein